MQGTLNNCCSTNYVTPASLPNLFVSYGGVLSGTVDPTTPPPVNGASWIYTNLTSGVTFSWNPNTQAWQ